MGYKVIKRGIQYHTFGLKRHTSKGNLEISWNVIVEIWSTLRQIFILSSKTVWKSSHFERFYEELTVGLYVATMQEKLFRSSDDNLWHQKNRQIQWNEGFFISTVAFWEKRDFLKLISFYFPCTRMPALRLATGLNLLKIIWKGPRFEFKCCDDCYFCQLLCQFSQLLVK